MRNILRWLDDYLLSILAGFLLFFIPLYPKWPLFDALPGYIVRVRLEDLLVLFTFILWLIYLIAGKIKLSKNPLILMIGAYLVVGLLSMVSALVYTKTVPLETIHVGKMILHFLRRIEYFSLFFIFYTSIKSLKQLKIYLLIFLASVLGVVIYGFGQKYLFWPAFSTMNREFAKGWALYLTRHARVISTFGGHYDLAAFMMMALIVLWSLFFALKKRLWQVLVFLLLAGAFWTLILTASRTSFIAYLVGLTALFSFWSFRKGIGWSSKRWLAVTTLSIVVMLSFGDLSERFTKLLRIDERVGGIKSLLMSPIGKPPSDRAWFLDNTADQLSQITSRSDQPPSRERPIDVYEDIPLNIPEATDSGVVTTAKRTYSPTAFAFDLSTAIRLDALWPRAIAGFVKNPLLGTGYSTLTKTQVEEFTEAESTDNDYLRALGETGILGFVTFFGILLMMIYIIWRNLSVVSDPIILSFTLGLGALLIGLLVNALYIDVFESSKVAFSFWAISGMVLSAVNIAKKDYQKKGIKTKTVDFKKTISGAKNKIKRFIKSDIFFLLIILILAFALRLYKINTPLADWHSWRQADTSSVTRNYVKHGINLLFPVYDDLSNVASGKDNPRRLRLVEFPIYNFAAVVVDKLFVGYNVEFSGRLTSVFASLGSIVFLFLLVRKYLGKKIAFLATFFYAVLPYNIYYTRVILPEPFLVFASLGMIWFFDLMIEKIFSFQFSVFSLKKNIEILLYILVSFLFTASALLIKPYAAFLFLPMVYLWFKNLGISTKSVITFLCYWIISVLPLVCWRLWISQYPEGIPAYMWLFNGDNIRFKGAFFFWIFAERLSKIILGYFGLPFLILGILADKKRHEWLFYLWGISMLAYVTIFATGNVRHDYYQIITIPIISIFLAKGIMFLVELSRTYRINRIKIYGVIVILILFTLMFTWYHIRDFYNINHPEIVQAGRALERISSDRALVIAPYNGDTAFLYQTGRAGWPIVQDPIDEMVNKGADYYISVNYDDLTNQLISLATHKDPEIRKYKLIEKEDNYVIIQLVPDSKLPK